MDVRILTPGSLLLTPALQEMKVHPEMLLKTKERGIRGHGNRGRSAPDSDSWLLTPDSCSSRNEGASGDVDENKGASEVRGRSEGLCGWCADSDSWLLTPDSCSSRNEGASGDVVENKGRQKERCPVSGSVGLGCKLARRGLRNRKYFLGRYPPSEGNRPQSRVPPSLYDGGAGNTPVRISREVIENAKAPETAICHQMGVLHLPTICGSAAWLSWHTSRVVGYTENL